MSSIFSLQINQKFLVLLLAIAMFPHLMILSMFNMNSTFTASFLDLEVDDLQFMFAIAYGTIVCGLFIHIRFFHYFNIKSYLLLMTSLSMLILFAMTFTTNTQLLILLRFIQGPIALFEGCILLPIIMSQMKRYYAKIVAYSILYCFMMTSDKFSTSIIKFAIENYSHNMILYTMIMFHTAALLIYVFVFNNNRMFAKKPLYQLNIPGILLLLVSLLSGAFCLIFGKKYDWFDSYKIVLSFVSALTFGALFILHQKTSKRALFHFSVFKSERVVTGMVIFLFFYLFRASLSNVYQIMGTVWKWPWTNILTIQYFNVIGTVVGAAISAFLMIKEVQYRYIFTAGFLLLATAMMWFSHLFYPDISQYQIAYPLGIEGLAQGIIFTPLVLYMIGAVHPSFAGNVAMVGTAMRFWSSIIGFSIMQNLVLHLTTKIQTHLGNSMDLANPTFYDQWNDVMQKTSSTLLPNEAISLTTEQFNTELVNQSLLLANIDVFTVLFWLGLAIAMICLFYEPAKNFIQLKFK